MSSTRSTNFCWENGLKFLERMREKGDHLFKDLEPALFQFEPGMAVEICGEAGIGKSELLLNLIAKCVLPVNCTLVLGPTSVEKVRLGGVDTRVIYVDNDYHFSMFRLATIMHSKISKAVDDHVGERQLPSDFDFEEFVSNTCESALKNLLLIHCTGGLQFAANLRHLEEVTVRETPFTVLVLDSISAFYWTDRSIQETYAALCEFHRGMCRSLRKLMDVHKVTVLCTNQDLWKRAQARRFESRVKSTESAAAAAATTSRTTDTPPVNHSAMGKDFEALWTWRLRLTRDEDRYFTPEVLSNIDMTPVNQVLVDVRNNDGRLVRKISFDIDDNGITFNV